MYRETGSAPTSVALGELALRALAIETYPGMFGRVATSLDEHIASIVQSAKKGELFVYGMKVTDRVGAD